MTPAPTIDELIRTVVNDATSADPLDQLATASATVSELAEVGDAVLGYFVDQCRRNGRSWSEISTSLGVTKQAAHKRFSFTPAFARFTARAKTALEAAADAARELKHGSVGTEHLAIGLVADPGSIAGKVLREAGVTKAKLTSDLAPGTTRVEGTPPFTPRAATVMSQTLTEALTLGHNYIGTEHMLLAVLDDPDGLGAKLLGAMRVTKASARARVVELLSEYGAKKA